MTYTGTRDKPFFDEDERRYPPTDPLPSLVFPEDLAEDIRVTAAISKVDCCWAQLPAPDNREIFARVVPGAPTFFSPDGERWRHWGCLHHKVQRLVVVLQVGVWLPMGETRHMLQVLGRIF